MATQWKFKVEVKKSVAPTVEFTYEYHAVIKSRNGEIVFTGEPRKRKSALIKTINNLFPGVVIVDKTQSKK